MQSKLFAVFALVAGLTAADDVDSWKNVTYATQIMAPGSTTPLHSYGFASESKQEPEHPHQLTALGKRQHYLIGHELRERYVNEAENFLGKDYLVSSLYMQTAQESASILSMQAQMMGLYPASDQNELSEWQQQNAVPPIEGVDFSKWQAELGNQALPHGINTFPIQMFGIEKDFLLSTGKNCPSFEKKFNDAWSSRDEALSGQFQRRFPEQAKAIKSNDGTLGDFCHYMSWSILNGVKLTMEPQRFTDVNEFCDNYTEEKVSMMKEVSAKEENILSSSMIKDLINQLDHVENLESNTMPVPLVYRTYTTLNTEILDVIVDAVMSPLNSSQKPLPAASTLIFQVQDGNVETRLNDESIFTTDVSSFKEFLQLIPVTKDVETVCQNQTDH